MALADLTINDGQGTPIAHVFTYIGTDQQGRILRKDFARSTDLPLTMVVGHKKSTAKGISVDSHLVRFDDARMDADGVTVRFGNCRIMIDCDPDIASDAIAADYAAFIRNFATEANIKLLMKGSVF